MFIIMWFQKTFNERETFLMWGNAVEALWNSMKFCAVLKLCTLECQIEGGLE